MPLPRQVLQGWWIILPVPPHLEQALDHAEGGALADADLTGTAAVGAYLGGGALSAACAAAVRAGLNAVDSDFLLAAEGRFLKADVHRGPEILALAGGVGVCALSAAEAAKAAEYIAENVAKAAKTIEAAEAAAVEAGVGVKGCMAELVILLALFIVGENLVGLVGLLEALLAGLVAGVQVRVVCLGYLSVCLFYLIG